MTDKLTFPEWLRQKRRELDLSRKQLADLVGCAEITLRRIETGTLKPSKELAAILLERLGIGPEQRDQWVQFARGTGDLPDLRPSATNLPHLLTSFIGREAEQAEVIGLFNMHRLVSLVGVGGIGKTRLALSVGNRCLPRYPAGVWLIELATITSPELIPPAIATTIGLASTDAPPTPERLWKHLAAKELLLILDNCEHVLVATATLVDLLLSHCPLLHVLTTSRESLRVSGEAVYSIPPLPNSDTKGISDAAQLFIERVRLGQRDFELTAQNARLVSHICQRLDGIPLALELAAAQTNWLSLSEIAAQLDESLELFANESPTTPPRLQSMRASLDWSWGLLSEAERRFMSRLAIFADSWTLHAAQAVCSDNTLTNAMIKTLLVNLLRKSLIVARQTVTKETRYAFHDLVHRYAHEKLLATGEASLIAQRHVEHFVTMAELAETNMHGPNEHRYLLLLGDDLPNLRVAFAAAMAHNSHLALRLATALAWFWLRSGLLYEGRGWLEQSLAAQLAHDRQHRQRALAAAGWLAHYQGDYPAALALAEASMQLADAHGDAIGIANARCILADSLIWLGQIDTAYAHLTDAIRLYRENGATWELAHGLTELGFLFLRMHALDEAESVLQEGLRLARGQGDRWNTSVALSNLGTRAMLAGDLERGRSYLEESLTIAQSSGDILNISWAMGQLGQIALQQGDYERARGFFQAVLADCRTAGFASGEAEMLRRLGQIAIYTTDLDSAEALLRQSAAIYATLQEHAICSCWLNFAQLAEQRANWPLVVALLSVIDHYQSIYAIPLPAADQSIFDGLIGRAKDQLDTSTYTTMWAYAAHYSRNVYELLARIEDDSL